MSGMRLLKNKILFKSYKIDSLRMASAMLQVQHQVLEKRAKPDTVIGPKNDSNECGYTWNQGIWPSQGKVL